MYSIFTKTYKSKSNKSFYKKMCKDTISWCTYGAIYIQELYNSMDFKLFFLTVPQMYVLKIFF